MIKLIWLSLFFSSIAFGRSANQVYVMPTSGNIPGWGQVPLGSSAAVTGESAGACYATSSSSALIFGTLPIADGGTNAITANAGFNNLSPMTTLGDTIYGGASGAGTRLAGYTTSGIALHTQTGTGSASAAPAWNAIASLLVPANLGTITDGTTLDQSGSGSSLEIKSGGVGTTQIASSAVTQIKLSPRPTPIPTQASSGGFAGTLISSYSNATTGYITAATISLVTTGRPVYVGLAPPANGSVGYIGSFSSSSTSAIQTIYQIENSTTSVTYQFQFYLGVTTAQTSGMVDYKPCGTSWAIDFPTAGTNVYIFQGKENAGGGATATIINCEFVAYEI